MKYGKFVSTDHVPCSQMEMDNFKNHFCNLPIVKKMMAELERNSILYDGVLLDAKFFEKEDDFPDTEDTDYVHRAKERILQLPKKFDIHILWV